MPKYKLKLSTEFSNMFYSTLFPFRNLSSQYVNLIYLKVYRSLNIAIKFPYSFSKFYSPKGNLSIRKIVIDNRFIIFYEVIDNTIEVLYFFDGRRSYENMIIY